MIARCRSGALFFALLLFVSIRAARAEPLPKVRTLVVVLAPGVSLADWQQPHLPTLRHLLQSMPIALLPTRAGGAEPLAAYRTLATGTRAPMPGEPGLGEVLRTSGVRTVALGGEGASVLAGQPFEEARQPPWRVRRADAPFGRATDPAGLARAVQHALSPGGGVPLCVFVAFDDLARADDYARWCLSSARAEQRRDALMRLDSLLAALTLRDRDAGLLVVAPQPSSEAAVRRERLTPVLFWQAAARSALLTSPSTRRTPGLVANTDVAATIAALFGLPPRRSAIGAGRPMEITPVPGEKAADYYLARRAAGWAAQAREQRLLVGVPWLLAIALLGMCLLAARPGQRSSAGSLAAGTASVPPALLLTAAVSPVTGGGEWVVYTLALAVSGLLFLIARRFPAATVLVIVCAATSALVIVDCLLGGPLLARSPLSYSPGEAARFYGIGNEVEGVFLGASLAAASGTGRIGTAMMAVLVTLALGLPDLGADFGGLVAATLGFGFLLLTLPGSGFSARRLLVITVLIALLIAGVVIRDAGRESGTRTHVGQAVRATRERGPQALGEIAVRKAALGARLLVTSPWAVLFFTEIGVGAWLLRRRIHRDLPERTRAAVRAILVAGAAALVINDSGVVAAAGCLLYGVCLVIASGATSRPAKTASRPPAAGR